MLGMLMPQGVFAQSKNLFGKVYMMTKNGKTGIYDKEYKKWAMEQIYDSIVNVGITYYCHEYSLDYDYVGYINGSITLAEYPGSKKPITNIQDYKYLGEGKNCHGLALKRTNKWAWIPGSKTSSVADAETISYEFDSIAPFKPLNPISLAHYLIGYKNGYMNLYDVYTKEKFIDSEQIISVSPIYSPFFNTWEGRADAIMIKNAANKLGITVFGPRHYIKPITLAPQYDQIEIDTLKTYMYCTNVDKNVLDIYSFLLRVGSPMKFTLEYTTTPGGVNNFFAFKKEQEQLKKEEELKKQKAKEYAAKTGLTVEVKTKTHTLNAYPSWAGIFKNAEKYSDLRSDYGDKKPSELFNEAPDGWLKDASYVYSMHIKFEETENFTLEKNKQNFIALAMRRSELPKEKIKLVEEQFTLPDGRKAMVLFYVCADAQGMVGGYYVDCDLSFVSEKSPTTITSYTFFIDGGAPELPQQEAAAWKDYFKNVLLSIRPN
jgi:hypothetical protein